MGDVARVQVILPYTSGVPADVISNTWHFESLDGESITSAKVSTLFGRLVTFYNLVYTNAAYKAMAGYINPLQVVMKAYKLSDAKPRTAVREEVKPLTVGAVSNDTTPSETSVVLSYRTEFVSGTSKASQRGRIYLGGITAQWIEAGTLSNSARIKQSQREQICTAASALAAGALTDKWGWVVYSDKLSQKFAVAGGWVDNAIDTQRRRGQVATSRSTFST